MYVFKSSHLLLRRSDGAAPDVKRSHHCSASFQRCWVDPSRLRAPMMAEVEALPVLVVKEHKKASGSTAIVRFGSADLCGRVCVFICCQNPASLATDLVTGFWRLTHLLLVCRTSPPEQWLGRGS